MIFDSISEAGTHGNFTVECACELFEELSNKHLDVDQNRIE